MEEREERGAPAEGAHWLEEPSSAALRRLQAFVRPYSLSALDHPPRAKASFTSADSTSGRAQIFETRRERRLERFRSRKLAHVRCPKRSTREPSDVRRAREHP